LTDTRCRTMAEPSEDLIIEFEDEPAATLIDAEIAASEGGFSRKIKSERLDGSAVQWVVVATTAITMLPKILDAVGRLLDRSKIRSITVGDTTIKNPTAADIRALRGGPAEKNKAG
jgi:hypothetical protein